MKILKINYSAVLAAACVVIACVACKKDPFEGIQSHERSIESIKLGNGLIQVGPAEIDRMTGKASVKVYMEEDTDLTKVSLNMQTSYKSHVEPSGEVINFKDHNNQHIYVVTSETGETREWVVELIPLSESILGTYTIQDLVLYGGAGPEYGGGAVLKLTDKPWVWPDTEGPAAELDNVLTFEFTGVTADGKTYGTVTNDAGEDGAYANFLFLNPETDVNKIYRTIPKGVSTWQHDYSNNTIIFIADDGTETKGVFKSASTIDLGNGFSKTITDNAFDFDLSISSDWDDIYSDYDKFVKNTKRFWIDVKRK